MSAPQILLVAGTHGNELNAPWLFDQWDTYPELIDKKELEVFSIIGNPLARKECVRYIDFDLNRSFTDEIISSSDAKSVEALRAKEILSLYGPKGEHPCQIALDFHTTTSSMGSSLVVYGRRPADLALAALIQFRLGLPIYLHEGDSNQNGFLVESWQCGLVIEIGPVPQSLIDNKIVNQNLLILQTLIDEIRKVKLGLATFPDIVIIHKHLYSIDYPRDQNGVISAFIHPYLINKDWERIKKGQYLFLDLDGNEQVANSEDYCVPVFINEASYVEKNIAMSLTKKEVWTFKDEWANAIQALTND